MYLHINIYRPLIFPGKRLGIEIIINVVISVIVLIARLPVSDFCCWLSVSTHQNQLLLLFITKHCNSALAAGWPWWEASGREWRWEIDRWIGRLLFVSVLLLGFHQGCATWLIHCVVLPQTRECVANSSTSTFSSSDMRALGRGDGSGACVSALIQQMPATMLWCALHLPAMLFAAMFLGSPSH